MYKRKKITRLATNFSSAALMLQDNEEAPTELWAKTIEMQVVFYKWRQLKDIFIKQELEKDPRKTIT